MPNVKFYINKSKLNKNGFVPIKANIAFGNNNHWKTITKIKITDDWDNNLQRVVPQKKGKERDRQKDVNETLQGYEDKTDNFFKYCLLNDIQITEKLIEDFLLGKVFIKGKNIAIDIVFLEFIEFVKLNASIRTVNKHESTKNFLIKYQEHAKTKLTFNEIDDSFFESLKTYAVKEKKFQRNTVFTYFANICQFLRWAKKRKYYTGTAHENVKAPSHDITFISLTLDELKKLYYFKFESRRLDQVRDVFCFGCLTGLRRGDLILLQPDHIKGKFIHITLQKSPIEVKIPLVAAARRILDKCDDPQRLFLEISHADYLLLLEKCCNLALINEPTQKIKFVGNERTDIWLPKYELITGHTSRKTFMTLSASFGVPRETIIAITGHQEGGKMVKKYLKIDEEVMLDQLEKAWRKLYEDPDNPYIEVNQPAEIKKLQDEIKELKKIIESQNEKLSGVKESSGESGETSEDQLNNYSI